MMLPRNLYNEFSSENFGESEYIYSCEDYSYHNFKQTLDDGILAVRVSQRRADALVKERTLWMQASIHGKLLYLLQRNLSNLLVGIGLLLIVSGIFGLISIGWWLGLALFLGGFFTTRFSQNASRRFQLFEALASPEYYETANRLSQNRLFMLKVDRAVGAF